MSLKVNFIAGDRQSICRNNAWAVVEDDRTLVAIVPAEETGAANHSQVENAFRNAALITGTDNADRLVGAAKAILKTGVPTFR